MLIIYWFTSTRDVFQICCYFFCALHCMLWVWPVTWWTAASLARWGRRTWKKVGGKVGPDRTLIPNQPLSTYTPLLPWSLCPRVWWTVTWVSSTPTVELAQGWHLVRISSSLGELTHVSTSSGRSAWVHKVVDSSE